MVKNFLVGLFFLVLIAPYLLLFKELQFVSVDLKELGEAFTNTLQQSLASSVVTILLGLVGALGLCSFQGSKKLKYFELLCLIPSFVPTLFFVTSILQIIKPFPFGITGIVLTHTLMYTGLAALFYQSIFQSKFQKLSELAYLEGASKFQFFQAVLKNIPFETVMIFLFLFVQFFTSFSIPLLVGHQDITVETLIYEKIRTTGSLLDAVFISFLESIFIVIMLLLYRAQKGLALLKSYEEIRLLSWKPGLIAVVMPVALYLGGSLVGSALGIKQLQQNENAFQEIFPLALKSVSLSLATGLALLIGLSLLTFIYRNRLFDRFLLSYVPLSTVLIGLSLLLVDFMADDIKVIFAMLIIFLPVLYRFQLKTKLSDLEGQIEVASLMGSTRFLTFKKIIFPQVLPSILFLSGLGAFWTIGDFAISQIIYGKNVTLALYIHSLVGSYRLELANLFVFLLLFLGLIVFTLFKRIGLEK
ncbi:MAG: ABC transporter permease subunit [Bdellovibrionota bacterium]